MQVTGLSLCQFEAVTRGISAATYGGNVAVHPDAHALSDNRFIGRLHVLDSRGQGARRSWSGRRMPAACWHAYRDVLGAMFWVNPEATVRTSMAVYRGRDGFNDLYPGTAYKNIGSQMSPAYMPNLCDHGTADWHGGGLLYRDDNPPPAAGVHHRPSTATWDAAMRNAERSAEEAALVLEGGYRVPEPDESGEPSAWDKLVMAL
jgi:hypothetical protein